MRLLATVGLFTSLVLTSGAAAQGAVHAAVTPSESLWSWPPRDPASLAELCEAAARTEWASSVAAGRELVCSVERDVAHGLAALHVQHPSGEVLVLAVEHGRRLRVVAGLAAIAADPSAAPMTRMGLAEAAGPPATTSITRVTATRAAGYPFLTIEVHSEGYEGTAMASRDDLVVCVHRPGRLDTMVCVERAPLRVSRSGGEQARATAALDASGDLHVSLALGTWHQLYDDRSRHASDEPELVPVPMRFPDLNVGIGDTTQSVLFVDQWRPWPASPIERTRLSADAAPDDGSRGPTDHEPARSLADLCARAANWIEEPGEAAVCRLHATSDPSLFVVDVGNWLGEDAFVAVGDQDRLRVVARIGRVTMGPTRSGATRLLRLHRQARGPGEVLLLETQSELIDHDLGVLEAYGYTARHATACVHDGDVRTLRCGARVPLSYEPFTQAMRAVVVPATFPYAWREDPGHATHAVVAFDANDTLRVTLREGSWDALADESEHNPLPVAVAPDTTERVQVVPMFARDER